MVLQANPNVIMASESVNTGKSLNDASNQQMNNALATEKLLQEQFQTMNEREKSRLASTISGAVQLKTYLDNNDLDGAHQFLLNRRTALQTRIGAGENIDTQETDYALEAIRTGQVDTLKNEINGLMAAGQVYGILNSNDSPANVREWQYYNSLTPEDKKRYLEMKRSNQTLNLGGTQAVIGPDGRPVAQYDVTLRPEDQPSNAEAKAKATAQGTAAGEQQATSTNTLNKIGGLMAAYENIKTSAKAAPSGAIAGGIAQGANVAGVGGAAAQAQGDFSVKRAALENEIRQAFRVVGSGATSDRDAVPFINMLPQENDASDVKLAKIDAAMQALQVKVTDLATQRGLPNPFQQSSKVRVTNGKETFEIDAADLAAAQAEGFQPQ